jgi:hypothetical protein
VVPRADIRLNPELPTDAEFWVPEPDEIDDYEGFGWFEDVWPIVGVSVADAAAILASDRLLCRVVGDLASSVLEYDALAGAVEAGTIDEIDGISAENQTALAPYLAGTTALEGLEAGVAGLVYALSAAGMFPAASCRGHPEPYSWSSRPVVMLAADRPHAEALQPLVQSSGCGFASDRLRPELLVIEGRSVQGTLRLGDAVLTAIDTFRSLG